MSERRLGLASDRLRSEEVQLIGQVAEHGGEVRPLAAEQCLDLFAREITILVEIIQFLEVHALKFSGLAVLLTALSDRLEGSLIGHLRSERAKDGVGLGSVGQVSIHAGTGAFGLGHLIPFGVKSAAKPT
jgi:hypothetical protein